VLAYSFCLASSVLLQVVLTNPNQIRLIQFLFRHFVLLLPQEKHSDCPEDFYDNYDIRSPVILMVLHLYRLFIITVEV